MQIGTTTVAFLYEATIAAGTLATTAAMFYGAPSQKTARLLFRFSLLFLPIFMMGMLVHRLPNDHSVSFATIKDHLFKGLSFSEDTRAYDGQEAGNMWPVREFSVAPGPFLPVPLRLHCPAKIERESAQDTVAQSERD